MLLGYQNRLSIISQNSLGIDLIILEYFEQGRGEGKWTLNNELGEDGWAKSDTFGHTGQITLAISWEQQGE